MAATEPHKIWRYEDLLEFPDDGRRFEIIDGELFEMTAPGPLHQIALVNLILLLAPTVLARGGRLIPSPIDMFFSGANPVQSDIVVLLAERLNLISKRGIEGVPNLLIEILSPSNPGRDRVHKFALYARNGVLEYWLVNPDAATVEVLVLADGTYRPHVLATGEESVTSPLLSDLSFPASAVFA